jgi:hypothetical protein
VSPTESIRARLRDGPAWIRTFQGVKPFLDRMVADGEVIRCKPPNGRGMNMVCLSGKAPEAARMTLADHFAERLSQHGDIDRAAAQIGRSPLWGRKTFREICKQLGPQAA